MTGDQAGTQQDAPTRSGRPFALAGVVMLVGAFILFWQWGWSWDSAACTEVTDSIELMDCGWNVPVILASGLLALSAFGLFVVGLLRSWRG